MQALLAKILEDGIDRLAVTELHKSKEKKQSSGEDASSDTLSKVKSLFGVIVQSLESSKTSKAQATKNTELFSSVVDWCVEKWHALIPSIAEEKAVLDIVGELQKMHSLKDDEKGPASMLPIHELLPHKGADSISTLLIFKAGGSAILPCSKIQFYADPDGTKLVTEVLAGNDMRADMSALVLNEGQIWVNLQAGSKALVPKDEQEDIEARLECAVF